PSFKTYRNLALGKLFSSRCSAILASIYPAEGEKPSRGAAICKWPSRSVWKRPPKAARKRSLFLAMPPVQPAAAAARNRERKRSIVLSAAEKVKSPPDKVICKSSVHAPNAEAKGRSSKLPVRSATEKAERKPRGSSA